MIGFVPVQRQPGFLGELPRGPALPSQFIGPRLFTCCDKLRHLAYSRGVGVGGIGEFAKQAKAYLADRWQIARHLNCAS